MRAALSGGADPDVGLPGRSALSIAAERGDVDVLSLPLDAGVDPDRRWNTPASGWEETGLRLSRPDGAALHVAIGTPRDAVREIAADFFPGTVSRPPSSESLGLRPWHLDQDEEEEAPVEATTPIWVATEEAGRR